MEDVKQANIMTFKRKIICDMANRLFLHWILCFLLDIICIGYLLHLTAFCIGYHLHWISLASNSFLYWLSFALDISCI